MQPEVIPLIYTISFLLEWCMGNQKLSYILIWRYNLLYYLNCFGSILYVKFSISNTHIYWQKNKSNYSIEKALTVCFSLCITNICCLGLIHTTNIESVALQRKRVGYSYVTLAHISAIKRCVVLCCVVRYDMYGTVPYIPSRATRPITIIFLIVFF